MTEKLHLLEKVPSLAQRRETPIEEVWELIQMLMQRKIIQVAKSEMSEAKLLAIENTLDQQNWKLELYDTQEDGEILYLRAFNWIVADDSHTDG
jgi:hypothetical protein